MCLVLTCCFRALTPFVSHSMSYAKRPRPAFLSIRYIHSTRYFVVVDRLSPARRVSACTIIDLLCSDLPSVLSRSATCWLYHLTDKNDGAVRPQIWPRIIVAFAKHNSCV
ncbi:hypothetical protein DFH11DRAFT_842789 [Phellopilus nigrolimitatus]|nr:hypothetical protein DFH11DRAFT_842789 [Phellopilus nigrolimitatus]